MTNLWFYKHIIIIVCFSKVIFIEQVIVQEITLGERFRSKMFYPKIMNQKKTSD